MRRKIFITLCSVLSAVFLTSYLFIFFLFRSDCAQQRSYAIMHDAYVQREDGNYETAAEEFQQYLDSHSSKIYWKIQEVINRNDQSSYENVKKALEECQKHLQKEQAK